MANKLVTIVIPIYKTNLNEGERKALRQCVSLLGEFSIVFVHPKSLDVSSIDFDGLIKSETFDDNYFKNVSTYNALVLSANFYERFVESEYILIYQLDAYVFKNELKYWCLKGYDYIGAPWIASKNTVIKRFLRLFYPKRKKEREIIFFKTGNGGFSLRKVASFLKVALEKQEEIKHNLTRSKDDILIMEDVFWSLKVPSFKIPDYKEAVGFAIDRKPKLAIKINNNQLPFGCHGFDKSKVKAFWEAKIV